MLHHNLTRLSSEFARPSIRVTSVSHTEDGSNYALLTLTHDGPPNSQHMGIALDFSGSMKTTTDAGPTKKESMIQAVDVALRQMNSNDSVTVVAYGSHPNTICKGLHLSDPTTIPSIVQLLRKQPFLGSTNPSSALEELSDCTQTLLLSDGQFNDGPTDPLLLHGIVKHPLLCGSIYPGTDMSQLAICSDGTFFEVDCDNIDNLQCVLASALSAPPVRASNIRVSTSTSKHNLPSIRDGCSVSYVVPLDVSTDITVSYTNDKATTMQVQHTVTLTGNIDKDVKKYMQLQEATSMAKAARISNCPNLRTRSVSMFQNAGVDVTLDTLGRVASSHESQFSIDINSQFCPQVCHNSNTNIANMINSTRDTLTEIPGVVIGRGL